jgi:hypothetical protein
VIKLSKIFFLILISGFCFAMSGLRFPEEDLSFEITDSVFTVEGIYYFNADHPGNYSILYPFPEDSLFSEAFDITVSDLTRGKAIPFEIEDDVKFIRFGLYVENETPVFISYKQELFSNYARYILMTTHSWGEGFDRAEYKLKVAADLNITYFSITPDNQIPLGADKLYLWQREDFMPQCDMIFEFEKK